jgi:hypothetical protein
MDNICHTLAGAALAKAGLERRTALGGATLPAKGKNHNQKHSRHLY